MNKNRLEAFSDGVFAIVITLLVLEIKLPEGDYAALSHALMEALPRIAAYIMSFVVIGLYWISHHRSFELIGKVDGAILWLNILLLLLISFIPFPTSLLGRYPYETMPIVMYGVTLLATNAVGFAMLAYVLHHPHLINADHGGKAGVRRHVPVYIVVNSGYLLAVLLAPLVPLASYILLAGTIVMVIVRMIRFGPDQTLEKRTQ